MKYQINPKGATVENPEFVKQQILARSANNGIIVSDVNVDGEYLTLKGKAMKGLFSYNELEDVSDEESYVLISKVEENKIDPLMNIIALKVQNQGEELVSDYVMGFDYNISQNDVTIEKKFVEEGETEYKDVRYTPNFQRPITIIDPETTEEVKPVVYFDKDTNEVRGKCKLKPYKSYFAFEVREDNN